MAVYHYKDQDPPAELGVDRFEFWTPWRRPHPQNLAVRIHPPLKVFGAEQVRSGVTRPTSSVHAWVADPDDATPRLTLSWSEPITIGRVVLGFDVDWDHPLESALIDHGEFAMPMCVRHFRLLDADGQVLHEVTDNHHAQCDIRLPEPAQTDRLIVECVASHGPCPAALFDVRCYAPG